MIKMHKLLPCRHDILVISTATLNRSINGYIRDGRINHARQLFDRNSSHRDLVSWNMMLSGYIKHHRIQPAQQLFDEMPERDTVSWNTLLLMSGGLHHHHHNNKKKMIITNPQPLVYSSFLQMLRDGLRPNEFTFSIIISALLKNTSSSSLVVVVNSLIFPQLHCLIVSMAFNSSVFVGSALMRGYAALGDCKGLCRVFSEILEKNVTSWNALILSHMDLGLTAEAQRAFNMMPEKKKNIASWTTLIYGFVHNNKLDQARSIFDEARERDVVLWTAMISGYVQHARYFEALDLFMDMLKSGCIPNHFTLSSVLDACAGCSSLLMGKQIHSIVFKSGVPRDVILSTSLVEMYAKCGNIEAASSIFSDMPVKSLVSWNSIIGGFARHGLAARALEEFDKMMIVHGLKPDEITILNLLSACVHGGLVEEGERLFQCMATVYGIEAQMEHYACMVDLYGRAGYLKKAEKLIEEMPFEPDVVVWGAFLAACSSHSNLGLSEFAAKGLQKLEKDHPAVYAMMSKINGEQGIWCNVTKLKKMISVKKQTASSWIESSSFGKPNANVDG